MKSTQDTAGAGGAQRLEAPARGWELAGGPPASVRNVRRARREDSEP